MYSGSLKNKIALWLEFEIKFLNECKLPKWKGNLIRGSLGAILKTMHCNTNLKSCYNCPLNNRCAYGFLYRAYFLRPKGFLSNIKYFAKPYTIKPPLEQKTRYNPKDTMKFSIVLFGKGIDFKFDVINAIRLLGIKGLGIKNYRGRFTLERVYSYNPFRDTKEVIWEDNNFKEPKNIITSQDLRKRITKNFFIEFLTPYSIIRQKRIKAIEEFSDIFPFILRKYTNILRAYTSYHPSFNLNEIKEFYNYNVSLVNKFEERVIKITYKNKKEIYFIGKYFFKAHRKLPRSIIEALNFGKLSNIGKRATYGHGWYKLTNI